MFIRSERLFLRPGWPEDWVEMTARIGDAAIVRNLANAPWATTGLDAGDPADPRCPQLLVTLLTSDGSEVIGCAGLAPGADGIELGYWIARERGGQGYATEAVRALLSLARTLGHRRIVANHCQDNHASGAVLRKAGFRATGQTRLRFCIERGVEVPAEAYALEFGGPCNCDDDPDSEMRAA
jgi:RimJ/RimL family protein N-acetyltransferase